MDTIIDDEQNQMLSMVNNNTPHDNEDDDNDNEDGEDDDGDGDGRRTYKSLADYWTEHRRLLMVVKDSSLKEEEGGGGDIGGGSNSISSIRRRTLRNSSSLLSETISTQFRRNNGSENNKNENNSNNNNMYEASYRKEFVLLINRISKQQRGERLTRVTFFLTILYLIFTSFMWWQIPNNTSNVFEKNSLIFFLLIAQGNSIVTSSISVFNRERTLLKRERAKKMYRVLPFFLAKAVSDMTNNIVLPISYGIITYWTAGLRPSLGSFLKFTFGYWLSLSSAQSMGFFLSILIPNMNVALILAPPITLFCFILAGFYIPISSMHITMKYLSYLSFARYGYCALLINEFENRLIPCSTNNDESSSSGITVGEINECPLPGNNVYESIGIDGIFANYWFNILILAIFQMLFMVGAYILLRRSK
jgi:ABC-type multidrug transport system permease subunit